MDSVTESARSMATESTKSLKKFLNRVSRTVWTVGGIRGYVTAMSCNACAMSCNACAMIRAQREAPSVTAKCICSGVT